MITLTEALIQRFPHGNEWARQALGALGDGVEPHTMVHAIAQGWTRRTSGGADELIDTLFILTDDRLGMGQTAAGSGGSHWIPTRSIQAIDAIDDSPYPLETIEMRLLDGTELCVGWSDEFSQDLVEVLTRQLGGDDPTATDSMPTELSDPSAMQPDASALDGLAPSPWVEQSVAASPPPVQTPPPVQFALGSMNPVDQSTAAPVADASLDAPAAQAFSVQSSDDRVDLRLNPAWTHPDFSAPSGFSAPPGPPPMFGSRETAPPAPLDTEPDDLDELDDADGDDAAPVTAFAPMPAPPVAADDLLVPPPPFAGELMAPMSPSSPASPAAHPNRPMAWHAPGIAWPEAVKGVSYLGGHPGHPRKRKNGVLVFSPAGIDVNGGGRQSWAMHIDWSFVERLEIFGPDEVMFTDHMKVDANACAVVVQVLDGTKLFFEVRLRRPPSLRATLAPILQLVEEIRVGRTGF